MPKIKFLRFKCANFIKILNNLFLKNNEFNYFDIKKSKILNMLDFFTNYNIRKIKSV